MSTPSTPGPDAELQRLLASWEKTPPPHSEFRARVWRRIAAPPAPAVYRLWSTLGAWLEHWLSRPAWAVGSALALLSAGLLTGYWQATQQTERWDRVMATRYVQSVDPAAHLSLLP